MRCLSVQQPWAWAICAGFKRVENRTWQSPYRGTVAIVASGKQTEAKRALAEFTGGKPPTGTLTYSAIIGTVTLSNIVPLSEEVEDDPHAFGPFCWVLTEPKLFQTPIPTKPKLRLYNPTPNEVAQIAAASAHPGLAATGPVLAAFARSLEMEEFSRLAHQANHYFADDRLDDLERLVPRLLALKPSEPDGHYYGGFLALADERPADAMAAFNRAIELDPECVLAFLGRKEAHEVLGDATAAAADQARALELEPRIADMSAAPQEENEE